MHSIRILHIPRHIEPDVLNFFLAKVSQERRQKFERFLRKKDAYRSLLGEVLVRSTLTKYMGVNNQDFHFEYNAYGKPYLKNNPEIGFNISHSGNWVVMILGNTSPNLGIDVEKIVPMDIQFATDLFTIQENQTLASLTEYNRLAYFFQLWTLKESYIKALGKGLSVPLNSFTMICKNNKDWHSPEAPEFQFKSFRIDKEHFLAACSKTNSLPNQFEHTSLNELYSSLQ